MEILALYMVAFGLYLLADNQFNWKENKISPIIQNNANGKELKPSPARYIACSNNNSNNNKVDTTNIKEGSNKGRFEVTYIQEDLIEGFSIAFMIFKDNQTGQEYLHFKHLGIGGLTPLQK